MFLQTMLEGILFCGLTPPTHFQRIMRQSIGYCEIVKAKWRFEFPQNMVNKLFRFVGKLFFIQSLLICHRGTDEILPYFIFNHIYRDVRRIFVSVIVCIISFILITVASWLIKIAKYRKNIE